MAARAILFDLDGTLAVTAPDLGAALNRLRGERGLNPAQFDVLKIGETRRLEKAVGR